MAKLNVNIDHVATLRQARRVDEPDPVWAGVECELGGASGITLHLREDRRHVQDRDVRLVKEVAGVKLNLEMAMTEAMVRYAIRLKPDLVTLVPEKRQELTTEGGLNCVKFPRRLQSVVNRLKRASIGVSAFIVPQPDQILACMEAGCDAIELHTGMYANARTERQVTRRLNELKKARDVGIECNLIVHAGHGLNYRNIEPVAAINGLADFNIGHSIVARSVFIGLRQATAEMLSLIEKQDNK
jgi:pyridoxine 5-phosphate synthase